ncbi:MAG: CheY-like chemotaxis protein/AraC-like DNA-binding protein [Glaciecola sp.]|jgi:CheY-like chemotaxis protein/AraC-like DNA-binding protein
MPSGRRLSLVQGSIVFLEQISQSNEYFYSLISLIGALVLAFSLLACIFIFYHFNRKLKSKHRGLEEDFATLSAQKKEILESLNFQQISVTNIGKTIQTIIAQEFEQQNCSLLHSNEDKDRRTSKKQNWQKVSELAERLAYFTLRNQQRTDLNVEVCSKTVFADNELILNSILKAKQQSLSLIQQSHSNLCIPKGALDKILRGVVLQASKVANPNTKITVSCDELLGNFNFSVTAFGQGIGRDEIQKIDLAARTNPRYHYAKRAQDNEGDLNLASLLRLVAQFDGKVKLVSALNYATIIYVSLPRNTDSLPKSHSMGAVEIEGRSSKALLNDFVETLGEPLKIDKPKVLIIDQNDASQMMLHRALQGSYQCFACKMPLESMQLINNVQPHIILIDQLLPDIDPLELIKIIRENPDTETIPIIICSGIAAQSFRLSALKVGANSIVEKPIMQSELQLTMSGLLEQQQRVSEKVNEKLSEYHSQQLDVPEPSTYDSDKDKGFIERFNEMMDENFANDKFTREVAADHMNVCLRTLNRRLNEYYSHNFKEHLKKYRLEKAKQMLNKGYTINEASFEVGFNSASYFSTCFKAEYGFAPSRLVAHCA